MDGWMDGWMNGWMDQKIDRWVDVDSMTCVITRMYLWIIDTSI